MASVSHANETYIFVCALCDSQKHIRWYCNDCQTNLCDKCKEAHTREKKTINHDIVSIRDAVRLHNNPKLESCTIHTEKLCEMYCINCNISVCLMCFENEHKIHSWKPLQNSLSGKIQLLGEQITTISDKIAAFKTKKSTRHSASKRFKDNIVTMKEDVNTQRDLLKTEIDSLGDALIDELSTIESEEEKMCMKDAKVSDKNVEELTNLIEKVKTTDTSRVSMSEMENSLRKTLLKYDVGMEDIQKPCFETGRINRHVLSKMLGDIHHKEQYLMAGIDHTNIQRLSMFTAPQKKHIYSVCPVDDRYAWLSICQNKGLKLVNKEGEVKGTVKLDFCPYRIAMVGTENILMTNLKPSPYVYKLQLQIKKVKRFADIKTNNAYEISVNERGEVFVSTNTPDIVILNESGTVIRRVRCRIDVQHVTCLSSGLLAVSDSETVLVVTDNTGVAKTKWSGDLIDGQKISGMNLFEMSCDHRRLFVPDFMNNQVYVLPIDGTKATSLLDEKYVVTNPTSVGVDTAGNVWIGCNNGTIHVMQLDF